MSAEPFIPFSRPSVTPAELAAVDRVIRSGWWTTGPETRAFEEEFASYVGAKHAIAVNSCTAALHVALVALGVEASDLAFVPTLTFAATGEVVQYTGATPVLLDVDPATGNMDPEQLRLAVAALDAGASADRMVDAGLAPGTARAIGGLLGRRGAAVLPVHFGGQACDMEAISAVAAGVGMAVVEDAAHAVETTVGEKHAGTFGDVGAFSFYATKNLSTGEGGMATTDDEDLAECMRRLSLHGISRDAWKRYTSEGSWYYEILEPGFKYNMTDIAAALGRVQLGRIGEMAARRAAIAARYDEVFSAIEQVEVPVDTGAGVHARHLYPLRFTGGLDIDRAGVIEWLRELGIGTSVHFIPLHLHPLYRERFGYAAGDFPVAERIYGQSVSLPIYPDMTDGEVERVCDAVARVCTEHAVR